MSTPGTPVARALVLGALLVLASCKSGAPPPSAEEQAEGLYLQATAHYLQGEFDQALAKFEQVRSLRPDDPRLLAAVGEVKLSQGKLAEAAEAFEASTKKDPGRATSWSRLGYALVQLGRKDEGRKALERAAALNPKDALALDQLARFALAEGKLEDAVVLFTRAAQGSATDAERSARHLEAAAVFSARGRLKEAADVLHGAVQSGASSKELWTELGDLRVRLGALALAEDAYRQGALLGDAQLWENVGELALAQGRLQEAEDAFRQSLQVKESALAHVALGRLALKRGDREGAQVALARALESASGTEARESRELAGLLVELGQKREALELLSALAAETDSAKDAALQTDVARLARELGRKDTLAASCGRLRAMDAGTPTCRSP